MLFAVIVNSSNVLPDVSPELKEQRSAFLTALLASGKLLFEGNLGDTASLMFIKAESINETLSLLQDDPFAVQPISSSIQIRPLAVNLIVRQERMSPTNGKSKPFAAKNTE